ncbi:hypothetical protein ASPFODRAFT_394918 [Aspergillus luchuensis CBS 106.47]|uniref:Uncharacterized protein n=1 Tax=Aspergillus luchuensis (strain CBS 106.47) TaxID=1137211 RepID=A0A1M3T2A4_ASPLC|nr:hypothetical protein ASPFODRAFT_394918 [Aspergillus luchuensis CBS 106.47]
MHRGIFESLSNPGSHTLASYNRFFSLKIVCDYLKCHAVLRSYLWLLQNSEVQGTSYRRDRYSLVLNITARVHTLELPPSFASDSSQMICEAVILSLRGPAASSHPRLQIFLLFFRRNARGPALVGPNAGYQTPDTISETLYEYEILCTNTNSCDRLQ